MEVPDILLVESGADADSEKSPWFDTTLQRGVGDKYLLRRVAKECFNLRFASSFEKRAIQFGSKIAKQTNVIMFGSNRKANGKAQL